MFSPYLRIQVIFRYVYAADSSCYIRRDDECHAALYATLFYAALSALPSMACRGMLPRGQRPLADAAAVFAYAMPALLRHYALRRYAPCYAIAAVLPPLQFRCAIIICRRCYVISMPLMLPHAIRHVTMPLPAIIFTFRLLPDMPLRHTLPLRCHFDAFLPFTLPLLIRFFISPCHCCYDVIFRHTLEIEEKSHYFRSA